MMGNDCGCRYDGKEMVRQMEAPKKYRNCKHLILACLVCVPILLILIEILLHGINAPYLDEWSIVNMYRDLKQGDLSLRELVFIQDNEHRIVVPAIIHMFFWLVSGTNDKFVLFMTFVFVILIFIIIARYIRKKKIDRWLLLPIIVLLFSYKMNFAWMWPSYNMWIFLLLFLLLSVWYFYEFEESHKNMDLVRSIVFAELGMYCAANGLFIWIVYLVYFFLQFLIEKKKIFQKHKIILFIFAVVSIFSYFYKWERGGTAAFKAQNVFDYFRSFFILLVNPFMHDGEAVKAALLGVCAFIIVLGVFMYICIHKKVSKYVFPECICFFCMFSMISIAYGRAGLVPGEDIWSTQNAMLSPQYFPMPMVFWIAFFILIFELLDEKGMIGKFGRGFHVAAISMYVVFLILSISAHPSMQVIQDTMQANAFYLQNYNYISSDMKTAVYYDEDYIKESLDWIQKEGLFCISQDYKYTYPYGELNFLTPAEDFKMSGNEIDTITWFIDSINHVKFTGENLRIRKDEGITVTGWAVEEEKEETFLSAYLRIGDTSYELRHVDRQDVAKVLDSEQFLNSGYTGTVITNGYQTGIYEMTLFIVTSEEEYCKVPVGMVEIYDGD